ncbi:MAG: amidohydrolase [Lachnospiraceae bacterium]|nr:amidohydrolase [Lachnospiraceae bacterium]
MKKKKETIAFVCDMVITMDSKDVMSEGVIIEDGIISQIGSRDFIKKLAEEKKIQVMDLPGKTILPGLHDCHVHVMGTGLASIGTDLYSCRSVKEVLSALKEEGKKKTEGWICGVRLDESKLSEKRPPSLQELTECFPDRGVYLIDRGLHYTVLNQKAYDEIGLSGTEKGLGREENGNPNGRMHEEANQKARNYFNQHMTKEQRKSAVKSVEKEALKKGITTIHAMEGGEMFSDQDISVFYDLEEENDVDFVLYWDTLEIDQVIERGLPRIGTDLLSDGSIGSRTAAFDEPYADQPDTCGKLYFTDEFMTAFIEKALKNHLQCGFHAIGQKGIRQVLDCYEKAVEKYPQTDARFRIEHFGFCDERDIERAAKNHIIISTQPAFSYLRGGPGSVYQIRTGKERERKAYPNRLFLEYGITVAGGSDSNVTPMDPLLGIHAAVNHPYPEHRVKVGQALRMFTIDGAYSAFEEKKKGSIELGKMGDLVVLSANPYLVRGDQIKDIAVEMTIKEGRIVYSRTLAEKIEQ